MTDDQVKKSFKKNMTNCHKKQPAVPPLDALFNFIFLVKKTTIITFYTYKLKNI